MTVLSKILLTVSATGFAGGIVVDAYYNANANPSLTALLPLGAIAFGLFLISLMMEKEIAVYDREQALKLQTSQCDTVSSAKKEVNASPRTVQLKGQTL